MDENSFGEWLRRRRKALDLTQGELADQVGCSTAAIRKFESEERRPSMQIVDRLAIILGIPSGEHSSFQEFARGKQPARLSEADEGAPWRATDKARRSNLPAPSTALIGREEECRGVRQYLLSPAVRLVTLIGPLGIGKTRLSLEVGRAVQADFADGVFFVALAPLEDASLIGSSIVQALGLVESKDCPANEQLIDGIGDKRILIMLDNCEHLVDEAARLTAELLSACPGLKMLATSREALRVPGEWLYALQPLLIPPENTPIDMGSAGNYPALMLFAERARAVSADFTLSPANIQTVSSICARLDGLPLAIELIAARVRLMSPQALLERMTDQFILSADGMRGVTPRQKTLQNAIGWSYNLLAAEEQSAFASLAVFMGGFTLPAAEGLLGENKAGKLPADLVASLLDKSLLQRSHDLSGETRYHMLYTIQQFALNSLRNMGMEAQARERHLEYFLSLAESADREMHGAEQAEWIGRVEYEQDNLRAALEWCVATGNTQAGLRLLSALGWPWEVRSHYREMRSWFEKMRALPGVSDYPTYYGALLSHVGRQLWTQGNWEDARALLEESRAVWLTLGDQGEQGLAETLNWLGIVAHYGYRDTGAAESYIKHSRELFQKWDNPREALSIFHLGILESDRENFQDARTYLEQSLALFRQMGNIFFIARVSTYLGELFLKQGDFTTARQCFEQHLMLDRQLQFWNGIVDALNSLGVLSRQQGELKQAEAYFEDALAICREHGLIIRQP